MKYKLGFLASHNGSNMMAIIDAYNNNKIKSIPTLIISNNSQSGALEKARKNQIQYFHISSKTHPNSEDIEISNRLKEYNIDILILAGYMKKIGQYTLSQFKNKILALEHILYVETIMKIESGEIVL